MDFLVAAHFFQDDVFARTCDLQDPDAVFGADMYYHNRYMTVSLFTTCSKDHEPPLSKKKKT